jgi:hypothetical protein
MPFRHENTPMFGPDDLAILTAAFDVAWEQLLADGLIENQNQIEGFKRLLAKCILVRATLEKLDLLEKLDVNELAQAAVFLFRETNIERASTPSQRSPRVRG